jgi:hypothetical protein
MAKGDKKDVASAKSAAAKTRKTQQVRVNETRTKMASPKASRKLESTNAKAMNKRGKLGIKSNSPMNERGTSKDWDTRSGRMTNNPKLSAMDSRTTVMKNGSPTVKSGSSSVSATKPSVASKANAKNKMKAQGAKIGSSPTSGYGRAGKK